MRVASSSMQYESHELVSTILIWRRESATEWMMMKMTATEKRDYGNDKIH